MVPTLALAFVVFGAYSNGAPAMHKGVATPAQVVYKVEISNATGVINSPTIRTLDQMKAEVQLTTRGRNLAITLLPKVQANGDLSSEVEVTIDKITAGVTLQTKSDEAVYMKIWKVQKDKKVTANVTTGSAKPTLSGNELLVKVTATVPDFVPEQPVP